MTFNLDNNMSPEEQVERLVQFVNNLSGETIPKLELHIENLRREINGVYAHASDLSSQAVERIQTQIDSLQDELDRKEVLDLRIAIIGLLISVGGIALSYGT